MKARVILNAIFFLIVMLNLVNPWQVNAQTEVPFYSLSVFIGEAGCSGPQEQECKALYVIPTGNPPICDVYASQVCSTLVTVCKNTDFTLRPATNPSLPLGLDNDHWLEWSSAPAPYLPSCFANPIQQTTWDPVILNISTPGSYWGQLTYQVNCPPGSPTPYIHIAMQVVFEIIVIDPSISVSINMVPSSPMCEDDVECVYLNGPVCGLPPAYTINPGNYTGFISISPCHQLPAGNYTVTVFDVQPQYCPSATLNLTSNFTVLPAVAAFTWTQDCSQPLTFNFTDHSTCATSWSWNFGDGSPLSTAQNPTHAYTNPGNYNVTLTINGNPNHSVTHTVTAQPLPITVVTPTSISICEGTGTTLIASGAYTYSWSPMTGIFVTQPDYSWATLATTLPDGIYTYTVIGSNINGCTSTASATVTVMDFVQPTITGFNNNCTPGVIYTVTSVYNPPYQWSFPTGNPASPFTYSTNNNQLTVSNWGNFGTGEICATVTNTVNQCSTRVCQSVYNCCAYCSGSQANATLYDVNVAYLLANYGSYIIPLSNPPVLSTNANIVINGTFTIEQNFEISDCPNICLGTNAQIKILSGKTLTISSPLTSPNYSPAEPTKLYAGCGYMWDRVYIENASAKLIINPAPVTNITTIRDAKSAIVSDNTGEFHIRYALLRNNNKGIVVNTSAVSHPGTVTGTEISAVSNTLLPYYDNAIARPPLLRTNKGIEINNQNYIQIGNAANPLNLFNTLDIGIECNKSGVRIVNNSFQNIITTNPQLQPLVDGVAVWVKGETNKHALVFPYIFLGGSVPEQNSFTNCTNGLQSDFISKVDARFNSFTDVNNGVRIFNSSFEDINIINNSFQNFTSGILMSNILGLHADVFSNNFNLNPVPSGGTAIRIGNPFNTVVNPVVHVASNNINTVFNGIHLINMYNAVIGDYNTILFDSQLPVGNSSWFGIKLQNCIGNAVKHNFVWRCSTTTNQSGCFPDASYTTKVYGISIETSKRNDVNNNVSGYMGTALRVFNSYTVPNFFTCNNMAHYMRGFAQFNSDVGDQGDATHPSDNTWNRGSFTGFDADAFADAASVPRDWYVRGNNLPWYPAIWNILSINYQSATGTFSCTRAAMCEEPSCKQLEMVKIIDEIKTNSNLSAEVIYMNQKQVFEELRSDPSLMNLGTENDAELQEFYDYALGTNLGALTYVKELLGQNDESQAETVNSQVTPENLIEYNEKTVNEIYLQTWAEDIFVLTTEQIQTLNDIALQNPISGGPAVYTARVMLNIDVNDFGEEEQNRIATGGKTPGEREIMLYPNPANGEAIFKCNLFEGEKGMLDIYDVLGTNIESYALKEGANEINLNTKNLSAGVYVFKITANNEFIGANRLVIVKQ